MQESGNQQFRTRRQENAESTRLALLDVATAEFARNGYLRTSLDDVVAAARVTKGALYHHFRNKEELFAACYERQVQEMTRVVSAVQPVPGDAWQTMRDRCLAFLNFPRGRRGGTIPLPEAMTALGWQRWREIDSGYSMVEVRRTLQELADAGEIQPDSLDVVTQLVYSLLIEAAISISHRRDRKQAQSEMLATLEKMLRGLTAPVGP